MDKPLKYVTHGQCDARPAVTFPAAGRYHPLTGTKLNRLVATADEYEQRAQGWYSKAERLNVKPATFESQVQRSV